MLKFLAVQNFALIEHLEVEFQQGLNLITGETGSGKSILVDAVGLLAGERASQDMVRQGFEKAKIEGIFNITPQHPVRSRLEEAGIPLEHQEVMIRREISSSGNNKVFINGVLSTQGLLSQLGVFLADIHGQHEQQRLLDPSVPLEFLDVFGDNGSLLDPVSELFLKLRHLRSEIRHRQATERERQERLKTLEFQISDIQKLQLGPGLDVELEEERRLLSSAKQRLQSSQEGYQILYEREGSTLALLDQVQKNVETLGTSDAGLGPLAERIRDLRYQLEEVAYHLRDYSEKIEFNPNRLEALEERLAEIQKARRKYDRGVDDMLSYLGEIQEEVQQLNAGEAELTDLSRHEQQLLEQYHEEAGRLSQKRQRDAQALSQRMQTELGELNMQETVFHVEITVAEEATERGIDSVGFLMSPNLGEEPRPLARAASGGELSRVVLALKSIVTLEDYPKTLVFDEVDAGIGGRVASSIGEKLARLAAQHQVFCVTHLPQIACRASQHFHVDKHQSGQRTIIEIQSLGTEARVEEIARMMAGQSVTETTRRHARELLDRRQPRKGKKTQVRSLTTWAPFLVSLFLI